MITQEALGSNKVDAVMNIEILSDFFFKMYHFEKICNKQAKEISNLFDMNGLSWMNLR